MTDEILDNPAPDAGPSEIVAPDVNAAPESIINSPDIASPQTWPDDWRSQMAGGDEKFMKQLDRFGAPNDVYKSYRELQTKASSQKQVIEKPTSESTPEQLAAYRESVGIPETADGYNLDYEDGTVIGENMKPQVDDFLKFAHENNTSPEAVKDIVGWQMRNIQAQEEALSVANDEARINGSAELRSEWGGEFQGNMNAVHSLFTEAPEGTMDSLLTSAGPDGLKFANNPDNIRWLVGLAKQLNPTATLVPPGPDQAGSIDTEIENIQKIMNSPDRAESNKYWKDDKMQARFAQLNQAKQAR